MTETIHRIGDNVEVAENEDGQPVLRNTNTGAEVRISDLVEADEFAAREGLFLPTHTSFGDAIEDGASVFYAPGEDGDAIATEGVYFWHAGDDEFKVLEASSLGDAGTLSDLTIDTSKDWGGHDITNVGSLTAEEAQSESTETDQLTVNDLMTGPTFDSKDDFLNQTTEQGQSGWIDGRGPVWRGEDA